MSSETITRNDLENILNELGIVAYEKNVRYGDGVSITSYTSASNPYTCPSDGMIVIGGTYRSGHYIMLYDVNGLLVAETSSGGSANDAGNTAIPTPVFEGQKFYVTQTSGNYCTAYFVPFTKVYNIKEPAVAVDYIVDEGTDNGWVYKKYNNGTFDAWRSFDLNVACSTTSGSLYCSADQTLSLPSFTNEDINDWAINGSINGLETIWFLTFTTSPPSITYRLMRTSSRTASNRHINMTLHGKWK